jgi:ABC-type Fe3+-siderophore transport system permease subunit
MDRPKTVSYGVKLYLLAVLIGFPSFLFTIADAPVDQSKLAILIGGLIFITLAILLVYMIHLGRNWARQIFAGLTIVGIFSALTSGVSGVHAAQVILFWVQTLLSFTSTVLFYRPASNLWFNLQPTRKK